MIFGTLASDRKNRGLPNTGLTLLYIYKYIPLPYNALIQASVMNNRFVP